MKTAAHVEKEAMWRGFQEELLKLAADVAPLPAADRHLTSRFDRLRDELETRGVYSGTGHKRIIIPKTHLTEQDLGSLGFVPVNVAIPEAGQTKLRSFRHPNNNYHIHEHGENWTMHRDEHPASTMLIKKLLMEQYPVAEGTSPATGATQTAALSATLGRAAHTAGIAAKATTEFVRGLPHVVTEGVPGAYYYAKGQITRTPDMADRVSQELPKEYFDRIRRWAPRPQSTDTPKLGGLPQEEPAPRTRVPGLKQPRIATPRLNPELNAGGPSNPFRGNWQKLGSSLRRMVQVAEETPGRWAMRLGDRVVGRMTTAGNQVQGVRILDPRLQGVGLGRKFYGEVARRMPGQTLHSDMQVSDKATRVWDSLRAENGWTTTTHPWTHRETEDGVVSTLVKQPWHEGFTPEIEAQRVSSGFARPPAYSASLPAAAKIASELTSGQQLALGAATIGAGLYTLKRTASQLTDPHPAGVGAGAGARTVQRVLLPGTSRAQVEPPYASPY